MDTQALISVLTWLLIVVGGGLLGSVVWFARRIVAQLDRLEALFTKETALMDKRITRLEDWRDAVGLTLRNGPRGTE